MPRYTITAKVAVDVEIEVSAKSEAEAKALFHDHICMTATLLDVNEAAFDVCEDSISDVDFKRVEKQS